MVRLIWLTLVAGPALTGPVLELQPPAPEAIRKVLEGGVKFDAGDNTLAFTKSGTVKGSGPYGASGRGSYRISGAHVSASGTGTMACMGTPEDCPQSTLSWSFSIEFDVLGVGDRTLLIRIESDSSSLVETDKGPVVVGGEPKPSWAPLVELIPASKDLRLTKATQALLHEPPADAGVTSNFVLVHGAPAKRARKVSEIYSGAGDAALATELAKQLAPVLGHLEVKPWPSPTPFQVLLVVGDTLAP